MILVFIYLLAVVLANMLILWLGPQAAVITAFLFIGLDLSLRDKLHDQWHGEQVWWKMLALICGGSAISIVLNWDALPIALASATAFLAAGVGDALVYAGLRKKRFMIRANGSNVAGSAIDSIVFPTLAFGVFMPEIVLGQFVAKFVGGFLWSLVLHKYFNKDEEEVQSA
jgi:hypothetical protein